MDRKVAFKRLLSTIAACCTILEVSLKVTAITHDNSNSTSASSDCSLSELDCSLLSSLPLAGFLEFYIISYRMQHKILECWKVSAPAAVLRPGSSNDIASIISAIYDCKSDLTISARGAGDSINGQDQALDGIVVEMTGIKLRD